jgi:pimeloyl-ACP methyl ester carboxylesterase
LFCSWRLLGPAQRENHVVVARADGDAARQRALQGFSTRIFSRDGLRLSYAAVGVGEPVVLLHGFTSGGDAFQRLGWIDLLIENGFQAVTLDFRSHGGSERVFEPAMCSTPVLAADVVALLDHLHVERAALLGFSMGGGVALQVAMDAPARVRKLVLGGIGDAALNHLHDPREVAEIIEAFLAPSASASEETNAWRIRRNAELAGNDLVALLPFLRCGGWPGGIARLSPITAEVMLVVAEAEEYMRETEELLRWLAPSQLMRVPAKGHHEVLSDGVVKEEAIRFLRR